ncbi:MAG: ABC transporter substrate-binding protein [Candidatus Giovannonibacteria bacterium]|nr:MAG: ABC transporter substrate-binding protein [Candidatus Giovannonibacteria bacterium]
MSFRQAIITTLIVIILLGGYFSWNYFSKVFRPLPPPRIYKIGFLLTSKDVQSDNIKGFKERMEDLGYKIDENLVYVEKNGGGDNNLILQYAKELNDTGLDVIIIGSTSAARALKKLQDEGQLKTKVFFLAAGNPRDFVQNLQSPESFITGIGEGTVEFVGKRLEFLKELVPNMKKVISVVEKESTNEKLFKEKLAEVSKKIGVEMVYIDIDTKTPDEILQKLPLLTKKLGDAYITCPCKSNDIERLAKPLAAQLLNAGLPSISSEISAGANLGFTATYSDDRAESGRTGAVLVDKILKGVPISQISVWFAKDVVLELNLKTAEAVGIKIPDSVKLLASKIYQ